MIEDHPRKYRTSTAHSIWTSHRFQEELYHMLVPVQCLHTASLTSDLLRGHMQHDDEPGVMSSPEPI